MLPAQRAELQKGRVSMRTGNLPLTKTIRSSHANHEASSIDIVQQQRKFGKVNLRQLLRGRSCTAIWSYKVRMCQGDLHREGCKEVGRVLGWTGSVASEGQDVVYACGT